MMVTAAAQATVGPQDPGPRLLALDRLRAFAILLVLGHHAAWRFRPGSDDMLGQVFKGSGWIGVDVFFVISGFMITQVLARNPQAIRAFFIRRFLRIVPLYAVAIAVFVAAALAFNVDRDKLAMIWSPALLLNGWTIPIYGYGQVPYTITWSLSVEETAYAVLGLGCLLLRGRIRPILVGMLAVSLLVRVVVVWGSLFDLTDLYFFVPARLDSIACGGLAALALAAGRMLPAGGMRLAGLGMFGLVFVYQWAPIRHPGFALFGYVAFSIVTALYVNGLAGATGRADRRAGAGPSAPLQPGRRLLAWLDGHLIHFGQVSYFIYLFHIFVLEALLLLRKLGGIHLGFWAAMALAVALSYMLAMLSWRWFEEPIIRWSKNITPSGRARPLGHSTHQTLS